VRIERIGNATLYLGDSRDIMPGLHADVLCTDPVWPNCPPDTVPGSDDPWGLWRAACSAMPASLKRTVIIMRCDSDPRFLVHLPPRLPFFRSINLPYVMPGYLGRALGGDETAYWFGSPIASAPNRRVVPGRAPIAQPRKGERTGHPMSRMQSHFDWLVRWCADDGEVVLDPFMGSGTTIIAAAKLGLPSIGIEIHPPFFDLACRRIEMAMRQGDMLREISA
jgi:site-specific DNA-methyltransferase (adenine-specific)